VGATQRVERARFHALAYSFRSGLSPEAPKQEHEIVMLQNFFDELRRKVPLGK
jgi:hypothetical protein